MTRGRYPGTRLLSHGLEAHGAGGPIAADGGGQVGRWAGETHGPQILICADVFCVGINQPSSSVRLSATPTACQSSLQAAPDPGRRSIPISIR